MKWLSSVLVAAVTINGACLYAGSVEGFVLDLNGRKVGGVTVQAFDVNNQGVRNRTPFNSTVTDSIQGSNLGHYQLDLQNRPRVVLLFSGGGSNDVFVPQPQQANANVGGAISGRNEIEDFDVVVPEAKPRCVVRPYCCRRCRRCR